MAICDCKELQRDFPDFNQLTCITAVRGRLEISKSHWSPCRASVATIDAILEEVQSPYDRLYFFLGRMRRWYHLGGVINTGNQDKVPSAYYWNRFILRIWAPHWAIERGAALSAP